MQARHSNPIQSVSKAGDLTIYQSCNTAIQRWLRCLSMQKGEANSEVICQPWTETVISANHLGSTPCGSVDNLVSYVLCIGTVPSGQHPSSKIQGLTSEAQVLNACEV